MEIPCVYTLPLALSNLEGELITSANALFYSYVSHCFSVDTNFPL